MRWLSSEQGFTLIKCGNYLINIQKIKRMSKEGKQKNKPKKWLQTSSYVAKKLSIDHVSITNNSEKNNQKL